MQQSSIKNLANAIETLPTDKPVAQNSVILPDPEYLRKVQRKRTLSKVFKIIVYVALSLWALLALFPIIWVLYNSFKVSVQIVANPIILPTADSFTFQNYLNIFSSSINIGRAYFNSIYTSIIIVVATVCTSFLAAFVLARYKFKGKSILNMFVVACMMFPAFSLMFPLYSMFDKLHLIDKHLAIMLPQIALNMGFATILLTGFLKSLPIEMEEAAYIDGAGVLRTIVGIIVPVTRSAIITCVIFVFLWSYNDLFFQTFLLRTGEMRLIPYLMMTVTQMKGTDYGKMAASATMISVPMLVFYLLLQKHIIKGLTAGAVKG